MCVALYFVLKCFSLTFTVHLAYIDTPYNNTIYSVPSMML